MEYFKKVSDYFFKNSTKIYLVAINVILVVFAIWFSNAGFLPFKNFGDFAFFAILALILGLYRPSWTFAFFVGTLALENINLAPEGLGISLRPYQFFGLITIVALSIQVVSNRLAFPLPKLRWFDVLPMIFALGGFLGALGSASRGASFKQAIVALSFVALYFLARTYVQSLNDLKRVAPFFLSTAVVIGFYGIWQNVSFLAGTNSFEVMPGRPNSTFTEADWLGIFIVFLIAMILVILYDLNVEITKKQETKTKQIQNFNNQNGKWFDIFAFGDWILFGFCFLCLVIFNVVLILTVSRSAWIGALIVTFGFLKTTLLYGRGSVEHGAFWASLASMLRRRKSWRKFAYALGMIALTMSMSFGIIYVFHLTNFQLGNRAISTGGLQKITVACDWEFNSQNAGELNSQSVIADISILAQYGCKHINLEDIEKEKAADSVVMEVSRPDPNINIRAEIYQKSWQQIKTHPVFGIGWGSISKILGMDERGAGLNASNIFLETWLGAGLPGVVSLILLFGYIFVVACKQFVKAGGDEIGSLFLLMGLVAIIIPNLFNSGIFLGFVWCYLAVALSLLNENRKQ